MAEAGRATASAVLRTLSALSPVAEARGKGRTIPLDWFRWLPANAVRAFRTDVPTYPDSIQIGAVPIDRGFGERLAAVDQIRSGSRSLRLGWLFVAGSTDEEGGQVRVFHPLVTIPVRVQRFLLNAELLPGGDAELSPLIADRPVRHRLEEAMEFGGGALDSVLEIAVPGPLLVRLQRLHQFARAAAGAAGFKATAVVPAGPGPEELLRAEHLQIVAGVAVFAVTDSSGFSRAASLEIWADTADDHPRASTAFHSLYLGGEDVAPAPSPDPVESPYVLTPTQRDAILAARRDPVTVVSGAPGTGKSHTIVAVACDALSRGESVLVAAKSDDPVDALIDLLERAPGPDPVVFGSGERRSALAKRLAAGQLHPLSPAAVAEHRRSFDEAVRRRDALRSTIRDRLAAEALLSTESTASDAARLTAPGLFDPHTDLEEARELWAHARGGGGGWIRRWREGKAWRALIELAQAAPDADAGALADALAEARAARIAADLVDHGGLALESGWAQLRHLDDEARVTCARWLAAACRDGDRINGSTLPAVTALATALRSGRAARRAQLARIDRHLIRALPLWIGSLPDIDDLLPPVPSLFDLVILDEASSIDQPLAAPALLRARRAVIVGDPHQLRHVSFLSDAKTAQAVA
ncbi:MAG TPA: AAA domain-containing protein, partial [Acidimicrobiales bacterium]|nr:AAA domain-containing protein [Acidimicrobiales bacterium]